MRKLFRILTILPIIFGNIVFAQNKLGNEWITGRGTQIHFLNNNIINKLDWPQGPWLSYFTGGNSAICDTNGNLILASDGFNIYDSMGNFLDEGDTMVPVSYYEHYPGFSSYSQSSIFLPMDSNKYYFVTPANSEGNLCFSCHNDVMLYSIIDMNANGGAGKVVKRMIPFATDGQFRRTQMMACRHANGKDWWLLKQAGDSNTVYKFLFTQDSVYNTGTQEFIEPLWGNWDIRGMSTFNLEGNRYATTSDASGIWMGKIFLADFDRCYGKLSNPKIITMPTGSQHIPNDTTITEHMSVALAFSPNSEILYVISMSNIYQYDLQNDTWFHVAGLDTSFQKFQDYDATYLGADGKIYIGNFGGTSKQMSRIDNPDVKGAGCNFCPRCLRLDSLGIFAAAGTPPCMPNYSLGAQICWPEAVNEFEQLNSSQMDIYPNPASTLIKIQTASQNLAMSKRELYNALGQLIFTTKENEIDVRSYPKGVYYLKCGEAVKKVIIE